MENKKIMGHFGFSYIGLVFLLALFIPKYYLGRKKATRIYY